LTRHRTHRLGDTGPRVAHIQWLLHHTKYGPFLGVRHIDGKFGGVTASAVKHAKHMLGYPKGHQTASAGDTLVGYLDGSVKLPRDYRVRRAHRVAKWAMQRRHSRMLQLASHAVGYVEGANNHTKFGEWYHLDHNPWCAMFVSWCADQAGLEFHYSYCPSVVNDARARRNGLRVCTAKKGAVVLYDWEGDGVADHIGIVTGRAGSSVLTIEGNTSPADFSNGGMVMRRTRTPAQIILCAWIGKAK
jgi:hypothetical protein